jgi:hypothetical protein
MKLFIETTGSFMLIDPVSRQEVHHNRPTVIAAGGFVQNQHALGHVTIHLHQLPDEADDAEFGAWLKECDGDKELAMQSYAAKFNAEVEAPSAVSDRPQRQQRQQRAGS